MTGRAVTLGPAIGRYLDRDIPEWIESDGIRYDFVGVTGPVVHLHALKPRQCVISPGLLYEARRSDRAADAGLCDATG